MDNKKVSKLACPECHSTELRKFGTKWVGRNGQREQKQQFICKGCGRKTIKPILAQPRDAQGRFIGLSEASTATAPITAP